MRLTEQDAIFDSIGVTTRVPTSSQPSSQLHISAWSEVFWLRLLLAISIAIGALLRLWQLNAVGYNSDEIVYASQGAVLAGNQQLKIYFPMFRAHPMLYQYVLALAFSFGISDILGRVISGLVGVANIYLVYVLGKEVYGARTGALAALFMALIPYHVIVSRQVLLDSPMTFCLTLTLYFLARYSRSERPVWLYATGVGMGLAFLAKETAIIFLGAIYAFWALVPTLPLRIRDLLVTMGCMGLMIATYVIAPRLAGASGTKSTGQYIIWQLFRRPNHPWTFYPTVVPEAIGLLLILVAIAGLWFLRRDRTWRETLLLAWIAVPTIFFQLWPVKGYHYLLSNVAPIAILGARTLIDVRWHPNRERAQWVQLFAALAVALSLFIPSWRVIQPNDSHHLLAGTGGAPGGREMGEWVRNNVPKGAVFMTVGPSMANIVQFYGERKAYGLSVSPNPLYRNPSYEPIMNPDYSLRTGEIQYIIWDSFSSARSRFFEQRLLAYVERYHGHVVYSDTRPMQTETGTWVEKPMIVIYEVRP